MNQLQQDTLLVLHIVKQHEPITRKKLHALSELPSVRFKYAMQEAMPQLWQVGSAKCWKYERRGEVAKL